MHQQRELQAVLELDAQPWAGAMRDLLRTAEKTFLSALAAGQDQLPVEQLSSLTAQYVLRR